MEVYGYDFRNAFLLHGDAEQHVGEFHCAFIVGNDDNLRIFADDLQKIVEAKYIGVIQWCVNFVEQAKGCRLYQKDRENKGDGR